MKLTKSETRTLVDILEKEKNDCEVVRESKRIKAVSKYEHNIVSILNKLGYSF